MLLRISFLFITLSIFSSCASIFGSKTIKNKNAIRVSYYNVDAFYDTLPNEFLTDTAFLPDRKYNWNTEKYQLKLDHISKVINALHDSLGADILGLTGIETDSILKDILRHPNLQNRNYQFVFLPCDSSYTGLGKAVLYNPKKIELLESNRMPLRIKISLWNKQPPDALWTKFYVKRGKDTLQIIVSDFDYKIPALGVSTEKRYFPTAFEFVKQLMKLNSNEKNRPILMGTFYKEPDDIIFTGNFNSINPNTQGFKFANYANLHLTLADTMQKTTFYENSEPKKFDHIHLNRHFIQSNNRWLYTPQSYHVDSKDFMKMPYSQFKDQPFSTFYDRNWIKGYSQHFPVSFMIDYAKKRKYKPEVY